MTFIQIIEVTTTRPEGNTPAGCGLGRENRRQADRISLHLYRGPRPAQHLRADRGVPVLHGSHEQLGPSGDE